LLDLAGSCLLKCTGVYAYFGQFSPDFSFRAVTANLLPVQRFIVPGLGSNTMLYLLAYECWAYLAFAASVLLRRRWAGWLAGAALALEGVALAPEFLGYLVLWVMGAVVFQNRHRLAQCMPRSLALTVFAATLLVSRLAGAHVSSLPEHFVLLGRTALDLQFGVGLTCLLLALDTKGAQHRGWRLQLWRLNRRFPTANSIILASHFPLMMFIVAVASHSLAVPIAGQPNPVGYALFCLLIIALYVYSWGLSRLAMLLVRLVPRGRTRATLLRLPDESQEARVFRS
jgi:hypothetical protein